MLLAEGTNLEGTFVEIRAGHSGEQVVLNLVVETTPEPVSEYARSHVASRDKLHDNKVLTCNGVKVQLGARIVIEEHDEGEEGASNQLCNDNVLDDRAPCWQ